MSGIVKWPTLGFVSGHDLRVMGSSPAYDPSMGSVLSGESAMGSVLSGESGSDSLSASPTCAFSFFLFHKEGKKERKLQGE